MSIYTERKERRQRLQDVIYLRAKHRQQDSSEHICSHFGCGNKLTLTEQLAGRVCTEHMNTKPLNLTLIISKL